MDDIAAHDRKELMFEPAQSAHHVAAGSSLPSVALDGHHCHTSRSPVTAYVANCRRWPASVVKAEGNDQLLECFQGKEQSMARTVLCPANRL